MTAVTTAETRPPADAALLRNRSIVNNFDLIRLVAASQVLLFHAVGHLKVAPLARVADFSSFFPGVPIFFCVSGFLISRSWERAPSARQYYSNRALRIYPALWVCLAISILVFLSAGVRPPLTAFAAWLVGQVTIGQFYNPPFLRDFGVGVLNGSLWTIVVELQFYFALPVLFILARRLGGWWWLTLASLAVMLWTRSVWGDRVTMPQKLLAVTLLPYLFFFLVGVLGRTLYEKRPGWFAGKAPLWFVLYLAWIAIQIAFRLPDAGGNELNTLSIILLGGLTISCAYTMPSLSRPLHGNDISYGVYIYHMPVINLLLYHGIVGMPGMLATAAIVALLAFASWKIVERPALSLKRYSARA